MSAGCVSGQMPVPGKIREERGQAGTTADSGAGSSERARAERLVTSDTSSLGGGTWEVDNNVWIGGDGEQCAVDDPARDAVAVTASVRIRDTRAILLTHEHGEPTTIGP